MLWQVLIGCKPEENCIECQAEGRVNHLPARYCLAMSCLLLFLYHLFADEGADGTEDYTAP